MLLGYNTNGLAHHSLPAAIDLVASLGFQSVAITIDHCALNPYERGFQGELARTREQLDRLGLRSVIETGGRYLLDPQRKHHPTLVVASADDRERRVAFHRHAIDAAAALGSDCVSLWAGIPEGDDRGCFNGAPGRGAAPSARLRGRTRCDARLRAGAGDADRHDGVVSRNCSGGSILRGWG